MESWRTELLYSLSFCSGCRLQLYLRYTQHELELRDSAKKLIDSLKHVQKKGHFKLKRSISYQAYYRDENGKWKSQACKLIKAKNGETAQGSHTFQLSSETTPEGVKAISPQLAVSLATAHGVTLRRSIHYTLLPDSLGYYRGQPTVLIDQTVMDAGKDTMEPTYEGYWKNGKREGFGFSIAPKKPYE